MVIEKIIDENASREADKYVAQKKRRESAKNKHITVNVKKTFLTNFSFSWKCIYFAPHSNLFSAVPAFCEIFWIPS